MSDADISTVKQRLTLELLREISPPLESREADRVLSCFTHGSAFYMDLLQAVVPEGPARPATPVDRRLRRR